MIFVNNFRKLLEATKNIKITILNQSLPLAKVLAFEIALPKIPGFENIVKLSTHGHSIHPKQTKSPVDYLVTAKGDLAGLAIKRIAKKQGLSIVIDE